MKKLTITDRQLFMAGLISIALISTGSMVGTWIGITGLVAVNIQLAFSVFEEPEQEQLTEADPIVVSCFDKAGHDFRTNRQEMEDEERRIWAQLDAEYNAAGREAEVERGDFRV